MKTAKSRVRAGQGLHLGESCGLASLGSPPQRVSLSAVCTRLRCHVGCWPRCPDAHHDPRRRRPPPPPLLLPPPPLPPPPPPTLPRLRRRTRRPRPHPPAPTQQRLLQLQALNRRLLLVARRPSLPRPCNRGGRASPLTSDRLPRRARAAPPPQARLRPLHPEGESQIPLVLASVPLRASSARTSSAAPEPMCVAGLPPTSR